MLKQTTKNCHWVSRMVTDPWEVPPQRSLRYYDFVSKELETKSSEKLFAEDGLNTQDVEEWLNRMVETPLDEARKALLARDPKALDDPRRYRAIVLMIWLQGARGLEGLVQEPDKSEIAKLAALPEEDIDKLVMAFREEYTITALFPPGQYQVFFPSSGIFPIPVVDPLCLSKNGWAVAMPLDPTMAIAAVPVSATLTADTVNQLMPLSVGNSEYAEQVVVPPAILGHYTDNQMISAITTFRSANDERLRLIAGMRSKIQENYARQGIETHVDGAGRIRLGPAPLPPTGSAPEGTELSP